MVAPEYVSLSRASSASHERHAHCGFATISPSLRTVIRNVSHSLFTQSKVCQFKKSMKGERWSGALLSQPHEEQTPITPEDLRIQNQIDLCLTGLG